MLVTNLLLTGLIDCYLASNGIREAMGMANNIYKTLGANAQTLTILATVCLEDPVTQEKAKSLLDKALAQRPDYTKAVVKKAELLSTSTRWSCSGLCGTRDAFHLFQIINMSSGSMSPWCRR